jgi:hypothetical protein
MDWLQWQLRVERGGENSRWLTLTAMGKMMPTSLLLLSVMLVEFIVRLIKSSHESLSSVTTILLIFQIRS